MGGADTVRLMAPNQPKTPTRNIRISDELWAAARAKADREQTTVTAVVIAALEAWVATDDPKDKDRERGSEPGGR